MLSYNYLQIKNRIMKHQVPEISSLSPESQKTLEGVKNGMGFLPNVFAFIGHSANALKAYLVFNRTRTEFSDKETEVINLVSSQVRDCAYCLAAHTALARKAGFTDDEIIQIRKDAITFDDKLSALANMVSATIKGGGRVSDNIQKAFFKAGYTHTHLVDMVTVISKISFTNYINNLTEVPVDFPAAPRI